VVEGLPSEDPGLDPRHPPPKKRLKKSRKDEKFGVLRLNNKIGRALILPWVHS
jgi:hypothetical protein